MPKKKESAEEPKIIEKTEEIEEEGETEGMPFPVATVVRQIRKNIGDKMISSKVKVAMNTFLGEVTNAVSKDMGLTRYPTIEMDDFIRATKPYTYAKEMEAEKQRVVKELEVIRTQIESMIKEFQRKFAIQKPDEFTVLTEEKKEEPI